MSTDPLNHVPRRRHESSLDHKRDDGYSLTTVPLENNVFGRLGELHTDILSTAEVVKQVQEEVWRLKQENETLRRKLSLVELTNGEESALRSSAGFVSMSVGKNSGGPRAPASEPPTIEEPELELVLPFSLEGEAETEPLGFARPIKAESDSKFGKASIVGWGLQDDNTRKSTETPSSKVSVASLSQSPAPKTSRRVLLQSPTLWSLGSQKNPVATVWNDRTRRMVPFGARPGIFVDPNMIKERMKKNIMKPDFNVCKFYRTSGCAQHIARSQMFESISLAFIAANTIWIAVDTEHNEADVLLDADIGFQIIEHIFCAFFFFEILIRFGAFEVKRNCIQDRWFIFDGSLVLTMVVEDWILTIVLLASAGATGGTGKNVSVIKNTAILRILRLLRLARLGRCLKLMRQSPEVMIMVKAMWGSMRCVVWTCVLLAAMMFVFGVCFTSLCKGTALEELYFPSLTGSLHTLMIAGLFPDLEDISKSINRESVFFWCIFVFYLTVTTICVLNLLVGVLVEVVKSSSLVERDAMDVAYVKQIFFRTLNLLEVEDLTHIFISKEEFLELLQDSEILVVLTKVGIDVIGLVDLIDFIFIKGALSLPDLLEVVLQMRSSADVTVKDIVEVRKFLTYEIHNLKQELQQINMVLAKQEKTVEAVAR